MARPKSELPGEDLVEKGLKDLSKGDPSLAALLVLIGAPRLRRLGITVPFNKGFPMDPEHSLYQKLQNENPSEAHSRYNALIRRLVSYERALEQNQSRTLK